MSGALQFRNYLNCMAGKIIIMTSIVNVLESSLSCYLVLVMFKCEFDSARMGCPVQWRPIRGSHFSFSVLESKRTRCLVVARAGTRPVGRNRRPIRKMTWHSTWRDLACLATVWLLFGSLGQNMRLPQISTAIPKSPKFANSTTPATNRSPHKSLTQASCSSAPLVARPHKYPVFPPCLPFSGSPSN
jgi:hypothetical protein